MLARQSPHKARFATSLVSKCNAGVRMKNQCEPLSSRNPEDLSSFHAIGTPITWHQRR